MKVRINKRADDLATYQGPGGCYLWDDLMPAFGLRIYPTGAKSFVVSYWSKGRRRFFTLGRYGQMTVQQARDEAQQVFAQVRKGEGPSTSRREDRHAPTVTDLAERHLKEHAAIHKKPRGALRDRQLWEGRILPNLGRRKVADVTRGEISKLIAGMAETPALANKARTLLGKAFNLAEVWGWRTDGSNPCRHVKRYKEESRERYLSESELHRLGKMLAQAEETWGTSPHAIAAIRLLILTGCRSAEILTLRWSEVDFERRSLHLADSKTGKRTVVLNEGALGILQSLERLPDNPHVIPGSKPGSHRATLQNVWIRIRKEAGIEDVRIHDLRHTFASCGVNTGHTLAVVGQLLGHRKILTTQRYAHLADDPVRRAAETIGAKLVNSLAK